MGTHHCRVAYEKPDGSRCELYAEAISFQQDWEPYGSLEWGTIERDGREVRFGELSEIEKELLNNNIMDNRAEDHDDYFHEREESSDA